MVKKKKIDFAVIKEHTFCGEKVREAIGSDCGIFFFKEDIENLFKQKDEELLKEIKNFGYLLK